MKVYKTNLTPILETDLSPLSNRTTLQKKCVKEMGILLKRTKGLVRDDVRLAIPRVFYQRKLLVAHRIPIFLSSIFAREKLSNSLFHG